MRKTSQTVVETLGGQPSIKKYVDHKLTQFDSSDRDMKSLFELMFSESENVMGESTDGYRIKKTTFGESKANAVKKAAQLSTVLSGVPYNSLIGLYLDNSMEWLELFWAILKAGYRPLLMNMRVADDVLDATVRRYDVAAVISEHKEFCTKNVRPADIAAAAESDADGVPFGNEVFLMSSNTSGHLKICGYTGEQFYHQIHDSAKIVKDTTTFKKHYNGRLKLLALLPFYHIFGLVAVYIWFCFFSRTLVFLKDLNPKTVINTVRKHGVTHIFAVPVFWEKVYKSAIAGIKDRGEKTYNKFLKGMRLADKIGSNPLGRKLLHKAFREVRDNMFGDSVICMINGGGYISSDIMRFLNGIGYFLVNGYGMTEVGITSVELSEKASTRNLMSVGKPFSSVEYKINEDGELLVRGRSIAHEVFVDGERHTLADGEWYNTHDLFAERDGRFYIQGRRDDLLICANGENINPELTEPTLAVENSGRICLIPSPHTPGKITLVSEVRRGADRAEWAGVKDALTKRVSELRLEGVIDRIALTVSPLLEADDFKVSRKKVAKKLAGGEYKMIDLDSAGAALDDMDAELVMKVREIFARSLNIPAENVGLDSHFFFDLGGTSIDYFAMVTDMQAEYGIPFPAQAQASVSTVADMVKYILRHMN